MYSSVCSHSGEWQCQRVRSHIVCCGEDRLDRPPIAIAASAQLCQVCVESKEHDEDADAPWRFKFISTYAHIHLRSHCFLRILGKILTEIIRSSSSLWVYPWLEDLFGTQPCMMHLLIYSPRIVWHAIYDHSLCCWLTSQLAPLSNP